MRKLLTKVYIISFMGLVVFFTIMIWNLTFAHIIEEHHARKELENLKNIKQVKAEKEAKQTFEQVILESEKREKRYLGYRVLEQQHIEGHFHNIGFDIGPDNRSYCRGCHGDMPHNEVKDIRAFLNMHAFFVACQTCHVRLEGPEKTGVYKWYDRNTGELVDSPVRKAAPGSYEAKIVPFVRENGKLVRIDNEEAIAFAKEYRANEKQLSEGQKSRAKKLIHKFVDKRPYMCEDCHRRDNALLPLTELGYPQARIDSIVGTEVVGMIKNYTKFYMPKMLTPGEKREGEKREGEGGGTAPEHAAAHR